MARSLRSTSCSCCDCPADSVAGGDLDRRDFLKTAGGVALTAGAWSTLSRTAPAFTQQTAKEYVHELYGTLSAEQKQKMCFAWDYADPKRGLLRTRISPNWRVTEPPIKSGFYTALQQGLIRKVFESLTQPGWHERSTGN